MSEVVKKAAKDLLLADFELLATHNEKEVKLRWAFEEAIKRPYFHSKPLGMSLLSQYTPTMCLYFFSIPLSFEGFCIIIRFIRHKDMSSRM